MLLFLDLPAGGEFLILFVLAFLIAYIFYLITLRDTLKMISPENRQMPPANIWLLFIPFFSFFWQFVVVTKLADSLKDEAVAKNIDFDEPRPGYVAGISMALVNCLCLIPMISQVAALAAFVCWIWYWVKISGYKKILQNTVAN